MTLEQIQNHISKEVMPHITESMEAFVLVGYVKDPDGKANKVMFVEGGNVISQDALSPIVKCGAMWVNGVLL